MADNKTTEENPVETQQRLIRDSAEITGDDEKRLLEYTNALWDGVPYPEYRHDNEVKTYSARTVKVYTVRLRNDVYKNGHRLTEIDPEEFNQLMGSLDADRARTTTNQAQSAARHFYRYHSDLEVDAEEIAMFPDSEDRSVDPEKVLSGEEVEQLRQAIDDSYYPIRNRAMLEIFANTGQRLDAVRKLRLKDIQAHEQPGYLTLNAEDSDLKGAEGRGLKRPLLEARKAVRDWVDRHPNRDDPDAWLWPGEKEGKPLSDKSFRRMLKRAGKRAGLDPSRTKPHDLRHYWVTNMKKNHGLSWDEICALGGWVEDSEVPKRVYNHISEEEYHESVEQKLGLRESEDSDEEVSRPCDICGEIVKPEAWDECPNCHEPFSPKAKAVEKDLQDTLFEGLAEADSEAEAEAVTELRDLMENPEAREFAKALLKATDE